MRITIVNVERAPRRPAPQSEVKVKELRVAEGCGLLRATPDEASGATQTSLIAQSLGWEDTGRRPRWVQRCHERNQQREYCDP